MSTVNTDSQLTAHVQAGAVALVEAWPTGAALGDAPVVDVAHTVLSAIDHDRIVSVLRAHRAEVWSSGSVECSCGDWTRKRRGDDWKRATHEFRGDSIRAHDDHQAAMLVRSFAGGAS